MIYKINNDYYVKVGSKYVKVKMSLDEGEVVMTPTTYKIEITKDLMVKPISFDKEKENIAKSLKRQNSNVD